MRAKQEAMKSCEAIKGSCCLHELNVDLDM
jgi:hypothetical protein